MLIASWNVNSIRPRAEHVKRWLEPTNVDVLLLQELKGSEFPGAMFEDLGYQSAAVTQRAYNGVAILSRTTINMVSKTLVGDELDSHARFLEAEFCNIFGGCERCVGHATAEELRRLMPGFIQDDIPPTPVVFCTHWCHTIGISSI